MSTFKSLIRRFLSNCVRGRVAAISAFVLLIVAGYVALSVRQHQERVATYDNQIASCENINRLKKSFNDRIPVHQLDKQVLRDFLKKAEKIRRRGTPNDVEAANNYRELRLILRGDRKNDKSSEPLKIVNCENVVKKP